YEAAATAVDIDPNLAEGHAALGQAILTRDFAWLSAEHQLVRSIELDPNYPPARVSYAMQLAMEGRFSESLREAYTARDPYPMAVFSPFCVVWFSYFAQRYDEAYRLASATLENEPQNMMMHYGISFVLSQMGKHEEAIESAERCIALLGKASHSLARLASAQAAAGKLDDAEKTLAEIAELSQRRYISPYHLAQANWVAAKIDVALEYLEKAYDSNDAKVLWLGVDPELDSLHGH